MVRNAFRTDSHAASLDRNYDMFVPSYPSCLPPYPLSNSYQIYCIYYLLLLIISFLEFPFHFLLTAFFYFKLYLVKRMPLSLPFNFIFYSIFLFSVFVKALFANFIFSNRFPCLRAWVIFSEFFF